MIQRTSPAEPILVDPVFYNDHWNGELCLAPAYLPGLLAKVRALDALTLADRKEVHADAVKQQMHAQVSGEGIATVVIRGMMSKSGSSMDAAGSTVAARTAIRKAAANPDIKGIRLWIESGGGFSAGTYELYTDVRQAAALKPVYVSGVDTVGSAAYWAAAGATQIWLNKPGRAGSIGSYMLLVDSSAAAAKEGLVFHRIRFGANKGIGVEGVAITDNDLAIVQKSITAGGTLFAECVAEGRRVPPSTSLTWATGEMYESSECLQMGLIDHIGTPEECLDALSRAVKGKVQKSVLSTLSGAKTMKPSEIRALCGIGPTPTAAETNFVMAMADHDGLTSETLQSAWIKEQNTQLATARQALEQQTQKAQADLQAAQTKATQDLAAHKLAESVQPGGSKIPNETEGESVTHLGGLHHFQSAVREHMSVFQCTETEATRAVVRSRPDLQKSFVLATNPGSNRLYLDKSAGRSLDSHAD